MYAYLRFFARDLVLFYPSQVVRYSLSREAVVSTIGADAAIWTKGLGGVPLKFVPAGTSRDYHFTGNKKPWSKHDPANAKFAEWYAALGEAGVDPSVLFRVLTVCCLR